MVIGAGSAGASACFSARKQDRKAEIVCINKERYPTYSRCALPFVIGGEIDSFDTTTVFGPGFFEKQNIELLLGAEVESVNIKERVVRISDRKIEFTSLVLATGGKGRMPDIPGIKLDGIFVLRTRDDGDDILKSSTKGKKAIINGASFIALEVAEALKHRGMDVSCVIRSRALRSMVDKQFSVMIEEKLEENGIKVLRGAPVTEITGDGTVTGAIVDGDTIPADMVVMCTGTEPDVDLARTMGLDIGRTGGIRVNEQLETSASNIFAAGDCAEGQCLIRKQPFISGLGTIATRQGMVAGANAAGASLGSPPVLGASIMRLFDIEIGAVGPTEDFARDAGFDIAVGGVKYPDRPHYYPGGKDVHVRLLADKKDGRIIGGQVIAKEGVAARINMLSLAIQNGMTARELQMADFCYSPPCSDTWAPEAIAATGLARRLQRKFDS